MILLCVRAFSFSNTKRRENETTKINKRKVVCITQDNKQAIAMTLQEGREL